MNSGKFGRRSVVAGVAVALAWGAAVAVRAAGVEMAPAFLQEAGERLNQPGSRLFGAIVETKQGPWFVKVVGPKATVDKWEESVRAYVGSAK